MVNDGNVYHILSNFKYVVCLFEKSVLEVRCVIAFVASIIGSIMFHRFCRTDQEI